jgi:SPP1 gp7 family putative phage head morphogenesis protein
MIELSREVTRLLVDEDILGLEPAPRFDPLKNRQDWRFLQDDAKVTQFRRWFAKQVEDKVLSTDSKGKPWMAKYVDSAYRKGATRAFLDSRGKELKKSQEFWEGTKEQFLRSIFSQPERVSKVELLATRAFEELRGVTASMGSQMNRILAGGMAQGKSPVQIAREMSAKIDSLTKSRALTIARTEIIHAHAEGQLDSFQELGEEVEVYAEWSTAGDDRVCRQCSELEGTVFTVKEARGQIPRHPNCRCAWIPASRKDLRRSKKRVRAPSAPEGPQGTGPKAIVREALIAGKSDQEIFELLQTHYAKEMGKDQATDEFVWRKVKMWKPVVKRELKKAGETGKKPDGTGKKQTGTLPDPMKVGPKETLRFIQRTGGFSEEEVFQHLKPYYESKGITDEDFIRKRIKGLASTVRREMKDQKEQQKKPNLPPKPKQKEKVQELFKDLLTSGSTEEQVLQAFKDHYATKGITDEAWIKKRIDTYLPIVRRELKKAGVTMPSWVTDRRKKVVPVQQPKVVGPVTPVAPGPGKEWTGDQLVRHIELGGGFQPGVMKSIRSHREREEAAQELAIRFQARAQKWIDSDPVLKKLWEDFISKRPVDRYGSYGDLAGEMTRRMAKDGYLAIPAKERDARRQSWIDGMLSKLSHGKETGSYQHKVDPKTPIPDDKKKQIGVMLGRIFDVWGPLVEKSGQRFDELLLIKGRAYAHDYGSQPRVTFSDSRVLVHELAHTVDHYINSARTTVKGKLSSESLGNDVDSYWSHRIKQKDPKPEKWLGRGYDRSEVSKPDEWASAYMGKIYSQSSTEVVSMFAQSFEDDSRAYEWADQLQRDPKTLLEYIGWHQSVIQGEVELREGTPSRT